MSGSSTSSSNQADFDDFETESSSVSSSASKNPKMNGGDFVTSSPRNAKDDVSSDVSSIGEEIESAIESTSDSGEMLTLEKEENGKLDDLSLDKEEDREVQEKDSAGNKEEGEHENITSGSSSSRLSDTTADTESLKIQEENEETSTNNLTAEEIPPKKQKPRKETSEIGTILSEKFTAKRKNLKTETKSKEDQIEYEDDATMPGVEAVHCPSGIMRDLAEPMFDVWRLDRDSMVDHIEYMYHDLGIARAWKIPRTTLKMFLLGVRERYQDNPYHNFKHCFCVTQMTYSMLCKLRLRGIPVDFLGAILTAAVCHDVDHPGLNNSYHSHARTPLAILYNYQSILEQHHFAVTCRILSNKERNIFRNVNNRDEVLINVGELILATDLARHKGIMEDYRACLDEGFDFKSSEHIMCLLKMIIKCADVSNEVRPETVAGPWVERLFAEYYEQSAREKRERLPVTPYMDPDMVNVSQSQEGFIRSMMLPMYSELSKLKVEARLYYVNPLCETLMRYEVQNLREREV